MTRNCCVLLTPSLRHYSTDLSQSSGKCCTPNIDCSSCRLYAQSFASALARATRDMRHSGGQQRLIKLWHLWCELFLNDDCLRMPLLSSDSLDLPLTSIAEHSRVSH
jgi:hypothetical protein